MKKLVVLLFVGIVVSCLGFNSSEEASPVEEVSPPPLQETVLNGAYFNKDYFQRVVTELNQSLPRMLTEDLRFDKASLKGKQISLFYTLVLVKKKEFLDGLNKKDLLSVTEELATKHIQGSPSFRRLQEKGGTFRIVYYDRTGKQIIETKIK